MKIAGQAVPHESATGHVSGAALYTDDLCGRFPAILHAWPVMAPHAHALLTRLDASPGRLGLAAKIEGLGVSSATAPRSLFPSWTASRGVSASPGLRLEAASKAS